MAAARAGDQEQIQELHAATVPGAEGDGALPQPTMSRSGNRQSGGTSDSRNSSLSASRVLWSRLAEVEDLHNKLAKLSELVAAVVKLHEDIVERVDEQLRLALDYATTAAGARQRVDASFSVVLNELLEELNQ
jgi:hypothetical protein